jgi:hypothetical protein
MEAKLEESERASTAFHRLKHVPIPSLQPTGSLNHRAFSLIFQIHLESNRLEPDHHENRISTIWDERPNKTKSKTAKILIYSSRKIRSGVHQATSS